MKEAASPEVKRERDSDDEMIKYVVEVVVSKMVHITDCAQ